VSEAEATEKGLRLVPAWWPVATAIVAAVFAAGAASATTSATDARQDRDIAALGSRVDRIELIDRRLARIEGKLGIRTDDGAVQ